MRLERVHVTWTELRVGLFVIIAGVLLLAMVFYINSRGLFTQTLTLKSALPDAKGLTKGDPVLFAGVEVGSIRSLEISGDSPQAPVRVVLTVDASVAKYVHEDGMIEVHGSSLTPTQHLEIHPGTPQAPLIRDGTYLPAKEAPSLDDLLTQVETAVERLQSVFDRTATMLARLNGGEGSLGRLLSDPSLYAHLDQASEQVAQLLQSANRGEGSVAALLQDGALAQDLQRTLAATRQLLERLAQPEGTLARLAQEDTLYQEARQALAQWDALSTSLDAGVQRLEALLRALQPVVEALDQGEGSLAHLIRDPALHHRLVRLTDEANALIQDARSGQGTFARMLQDDQLAEDLARGVKATSQIAQKLNTPGGTLDRLSTDATLYEQLTTLLEGLNSTVAQLQQGKGAVGTLLRDEQFPQELRQFIYDLQRLVQDIQTHPDRYVHLSLF